GVIRPILFPVVSVNQRFPSGPATITVGLDCAVGVGKGGVKENARTLGTISRSTTKITATAVARVVRCGASFQLAAPWRPRRSGPPLVIVTYASKCFSFSAPVASLRVGNRNRPSLRLLPSGTVPIKLRLQPLDGLRGNGGNIIDSFSWPTNRFSARRPRSTPY